MTVCRQHAIHVMTKLQGYKLYLSTLKPYQYQYILQGTGTAVTAVEQYVAHISKQS